MIQPGTIWANLEAGRHPLVIVSREALNRGDSVTAVLFSSAKFAVRSRLPNCVPFQAGQYGLERDCVALGESVGPIPKELIDFAAGSIGAMSDEALRDVIRAVGFVIEAECEPE